MTTSNDNNSAKSERETEKEEKSNRLSSKCRENLANPTRFPSDTEWESMTPIEQASFVMGLED
jgi:hypothetical protein